MMLDLLDWKSRAHVTERVRALLEQGALAAAVTLIEEHIEDAEDERLVQAARTATETAEVDWVEVYAEAIEANQRLGSLGETGCRLVDLELGNQAENRCRFVRRYYGPERMRPGGNRPERRLGAYRGILEELMTVAGLEELANVQRRSWPRGPEEQKVEQRAKMLAGHLLVLRFFSAVHRHTTQDGLPVPSRTQVGVQRPGGADDALTQLEPHLSMEVPCNLRPITPAIEQRLKERHEAHVAQWHENTEKLLHNLRVKYEADGYAPSFMVPDEVPTKERLRNLERKLLHLHPFFRLRSWGFKKLLKEIREVRERTVPQPVDLTTYRER
jgi:hypothetical protein